MRLNAPARDFIGPGADATLVTLNPDGSPQVSLVWAGLESTPDGDEIVVAHLSVHKKVRNIRRDPRAAVTIMSTEGPQDPDQLRRRYLWMTGTARIVEGGAPELLAKFAKALAVPGAEYPAEALHPGWVTRVRIEKFGGFGPWMS